MIINVFCKSKGWLFDDLKREIEKAGAIASETPIDDADAYICIRSTERHLIKDKSKAVIQIHDLVSQEMRDYGAISFVHSAQRRLWSDDFDSKYVISPIGTRDNVEYSEILPDRPTIGFFCREVKGLKRSNMFREAVLIARDQGYDFDVLMIGDRLDAISDIGKYEQKASGADVHDYKRIDALVTTSVSKMIPLSAYEALAAGRRVISTHREFDDDAIFNVLFGKTTYDIARNIIFVINNREVREPCIKYTRRQWAHSQIELAKTLIKG